MSTQLTWLGHGSWQITTGKYTILLDPFLDQSPTAPVKAKDVKADYILVSHGHFDHVADAAAIANRTGAAIVGVYEIADWFAKKQSVQNTLGMNVGGGVNLPFGRVQLTLAFHSSVLPDGTYGGNPVGFLLTLPEGKIYFACDTGLFSDMKLIGAKKIDLAVLPIGDLFTMGPEDSIEAIKLIEPLRVAPAHYNTWPPIAADVDAWAEHVRAGTGAVPVVVAPGGTIDL